MFTWILCCIGEPRGWCPYPHGCDRVEQMTATLGIREGGRQTNSKSSSLSFLWYALYWTSRQVVYFWESHRMETLFRLLRSGELTSACSVDPFPFQFCHCSQCFSLVCATDLMCGARFRALKCSGYFSANVVWGVATYGAVLTLHSGRVGFQHLASWTRMLTCPCWPRHGVVELIMAMVELMGLLFRAVYTGTRPLLTPAIRAVRVWRGRRELAPRRSATRIRCKSARGRTDSLVQHTGPHHNHHNHHRTVWNRFTVPSTESQNGCVFLGKVLKFCVLVCSSLSTVRSSHTHIDSTPARKEAWKSCPKWPPLCKIW